MRKLRSFRSKRMKEHGSGVGEDWAWWEEFQTVRDKGLGQRRPIS